jgi:predicted alpha/beta-fold hydrolase
MANKANFKPAWWLPGGHLQTLWPALCRRQIKNILLRRERFELPDGDFVDLDWVGSGNGPIVLILHGLEGSIDSSYAKGMLQAIQQRGWRGVFMHFRGCSEELNRCPRGYHSGDTQDVAAVMAAIQQREPGVQLAAVGFSLGGNVLLKWLGELATPHFLRAAVAISVPFELKKTVERVQQGFSRVYEMHFLRSLRNKFQTKFALQASSIKLPHFNKLKSLYEFDDQVTAPLHGFCNAEDYYTQSSSRQYLSRIKIPTLLLQSKDDPFMTPDILPKQSELSSAVTLELTEKGGHVGFVTGDAPWRAQYWLEQRVPEFLAAYLQS